MSSYNIPDLALLLPGLFLGLQPGEHSWEAGGQKGCGGPIMTQVPSRLVPGILRG